jgi:hypothetical protein
MKFKIVTEVELSEREFALLAEINKQGYVEYRDTEWLTVEDFGLANTEPDGNPCSLSKEAFLKRNFNGTLALAHTLEDKKMLVGVSGAWHLTYEVSWLGQKLLEQNN